jgi:hypothetical protein
LPDSRQDFCEDDNFLTACMAAAAEARVLLSSLAVPTDVHAA